MNRGGDFLGEASEIHNPERLNISWLSSLAGKPRIAQKNHKILKLGEKEAVHPSLRLSLVPRGCRAARPARTEGVCEPSPRVARGTRFPQTAFFAAQDAWGQLRRIPAKEKRTWHLHLTPPGVGSWASGPLAEGTLLGL